MDHPSEPDDAPPPEATQPEVEFEDPLFLGDDEVEELEREIARRRRHLTRSERRDAKKAAKMSRYPVERCMVAEEWRDRRFGPVAMVRRRPDDSMAFASGIIDLGCLGLKDGMFQAKISAQRADEIIQQVQSLGAGLQDCEPELASKILRHAVALAWRCGIEPPNEYFALEKFFGDHDLSEVEEDVPLGHRGKPVLIPGPHDDVEKLAEKLQEKLGRNGFYLGAPTKETPERKREKGRGGKPPEPSVERGEEDDDDGDSETDIIMPGDL